MNIIKKLAHRLARTEFASKAINEHADLGVLKEKPPVKATVGVFLMIASSIIGWPMITLFGALSLYWKEPLMVIVGGPLLFVVAHLTFLAGVYLAGGKYLTVFLRWATRVTLERLL